MLNLSVALNSSGARNKIKLEKSFDDELRHFFSERIINLWKSLDQLDYITTGFII